MVVNAVSRCLQRGEIGKGARPAAQQVLSSRITVSWAESNMADPSLSKSEGRLVPVSRSESLGGLLKAFVRISRRVGRTHLSRRAPLATRQLTANRC
jgi:hypothetical protein